jgi:hypothetical protein
MVKRDDPTLSMIDQGLDLASSHTDEYNLDQHDFTIGIAAYIFKDRKYVGVDFDDLFNLVVFE